MRFLGFLFLIPWLFIPSVFAKEPQLPEGLRNHIEPALPPGLTQKKESQQQKKPGMEPALPDGLFKTDTPVQSEKLEKDTGAAKSWADQLPFKLSGFWEARGGMRVTNDPYERQTSIAETRLQLRLNKTMQNATFNLITDLIYDRVADNYPVHLNSGRGFIDLREASITFSPARFIDIKPGRQILTWGTGDLIFINDLFPKDFNAFFIGRDEVYVKAPSDAVKTSLFSNWVNLDIVYTPQFDADRFTDGSRISFFSPTSGELAGRNATIHPNKPNDGELALRLYRNLGSIEAAVYFYDGYWKSPGGINPVNGNALFPKLRVTGGSVRGTVGRGIGNIEVGYYDSRDDHKGSNPFVNNSEFRALVGYEQEIARNLTLGTQYYLEHLFDYSNYQNTLPIGFPQRDQNRHLLTTRLTLLTHNQNITWSLFSYYSPSDMDFYLRPKVNYKINDRWITELGGNIFGGRRDYTLFGQFHNNSNVYLSIRYGF
jgi:hypothetical protein